MPLLNKCYVQRLAAQGGHTIREGVAVFDPDSPWTASTNSVCLPLKARGLQT